MVQSRREFLNAASIGVATIGIGAALAHQANAEAPPQVSTAAPTLALAGKLTQHELPKLPYAYDALEPYIDAQTMELHHSKHHAAYVKGLNEAEAELAKSRASGDYSLIQHWSRKVAFNGGGHTLHSLFWKTLAPKGKGGEISSALMKNIEIDFGSEANFKAQFAAAATQVEGAGWAILHLRHSDNRLVILQAENQQKLSIWDATPILALDVWEHAYYLKYQNKRADYIAAWWNVVNWNVVSELFGASVKYFK